MGAVAVGVVVVDTAGAKNRGFAISLDMHVKRDRREGGRTLKKKRTSSGSSTSASPLPRFRWRGHDA